ncbi:MAG: hypothetical protein L3J63_09825, partial [Geopsychrobacter sp.]|nr:hypothetical protein [Geopsychrobacter sp.]
MCELDPLVVDPEREKGAKSESDRFRDGRTWEEVPAKANGNEWQWGRACKVANLTLCLIQRSKEPEQEF